MTKITDRPRFKKEARATGLARIAEPYAHVSIIRKGLNMGLIVAPNRRMDGMWRVQLRVDNDDTAANCPWKCVTLKRMFAAEAEAREWLIQNWTALTQKFALHGIA